MKEIYNKGLQIPLHGMGPLMSLCFSSLFSLSICKKPKKENGTQVGAQMWEDDNGDNDSDHGEKWIEKPLIYNKVLS